jgi:hypothetical protein
MDDKTRYKFNTIKDLMKNVLQKNKLSQGINQLDVANAWRKVMGEGVWTYTTKVHLVKGNLTVSLRSSTIREELSYRKKEIIIMLNSYLKEELVNKIRLM